jgi:voltage-gated potassium channel
MSAEAPDRLEALRRIPLFHDFSDDALKQVLERIVPFEVRRGHVLVQPKQPGEGLFMLEEGTVSVELPGKKIELGPGEFFGELALLYDGAVHSGRVVATSEARCLALRRDDFEQLLESQPAMARALLRVVARRLATYIGR